MEFLSNLIHEISKLLHSDHPLNLLIVSITRGMDRIWHYTIFTASKQPVAVSNIVIGLVLFLFGLKFAKHLSLMLRKKISNSTKIDHGTAESLERISHYILIILMSFFVLDVTNVPLTAFTVIGTTLALGIGLGSQNIANNFISGLIIMVEKPIRLGDIIKIKHIVGKVTHIGARCVSLQTEDNINMLIPNSSILQDSVINWTLNDTTLKTRINIDVDAASPLEQLDQLFYQAMHDNQHIMKRPEPRVLLVEINNLGYKFELEFWINLEGNLNQRYVINDINRAIEPFLQSNKIKILSVTGHRRSSDVEV